MIAEANSISEESIEINDQKTVTSSGLSTLLHNKYPRLKELNYKFAINQNFASDAQAIQANDVVALLPPFAGG
jgi:molybdopterin converting factor small subunit